MRRLFPIGLAFALACFAYAMQAVQLPGRALACSCAEAPALAQEVADDPGRLTIVAGTIGVAQPDRTPVAVDTWFHGAFAAETIWLRGGTHSMSSCDVMVSAGERRVMVLWGGPPSALQPGSDGNYSTSLCSSNALMGTDEGDAVFAQATALFGPGQALKPPDEPPAAPTDSSPSSAESVVWLGAAIAAGLVLFVSVAFVARRRPQV